MVKDKGRRTEDDERNVTMPLDIDLWWPCRALSRGASGLDTRPRPLDGHSPCHPHPPSWTDMLPSPMASSPLLALSTSPRPARPTTPRGNLPSAASAVTWHLCVLMCAPIRARRDEGVASASVRGEPLPLPTPY